MDFIHIKLADVAFDWLIFYLENKLGVWNASRSYNAVARNASSRPSKSFGVGGNNGHPLAFFEPAFIMPSLFRSRGYWMSVDRNVGYVHRRRGGSVTSLWSRNCRMLDEFSGALLTFPWLFSPAGRLLRPSDGLEVPAKNTEGLKLRPSPFGRILRAPALSVLYERVIHVITIIHGGPNNNFVDGICGRSISNLWTLTDLWTKHATGWVTVSSPRRALAYVVIWLIRNSNSAAQPVMAEGFPNRQLVGVLGKVGFPLEAGFPNRIIHADVEIESSVRSVYLAVLALQDNQQHLRQWVGLGLASGSGSRRRDGRGSR
ncbi:hypothetical protein B0H13DRAFT_1861674 [Mycena leptocephala]|nr:hypothetical protein B0H13DRAFT_1861674 [Mycena leptocephala]